MPYPRTTEVRRRAIESAIQMLVRGYSETLVREHIQREFGKSRTTAYKVVQLANRRILRRHQKNRSELVARQSAKLEAAQLEAMTGQRVYVHWPEGAGSPLVHRETEVDVKGFVAAVTAQNKLLGLNAPEQREIIVGSITSLLKDLHAVVREFLPDPAQRQAFGARLRELSRARLAQRAPVLQIEDGGDQNGT